MDISFSDVHQHIGVHFHALHDLAIEAVRTYRTKYHPEVHKEHSPRSRASCIHDHYVAGAARFAEQTAGVELVECQKLWTLYFDEGYAISFKKLDDDRLPRGHLTSQVIRYRNQMPLDGLPDCKHLYLGYQLNNLGELHKIFLTCPSGNQANQWAEELDDDGIGSSVIVNLFDPPANDEQGGIVIPKKQTKDNETKPGDGDTGA